MFSNRMFFNRQSELDILEQDYRRQGTSFSVVYGRRRIGKTALITRFIEDKPAVYYYAVEAGPLQQLEMLTGEIVRFLDRPGFKDISFASLEQLLLFLSENIPEDRKLVLVIDEYQHLAKSVHGCSSTLQKIWDMRLSRCNIHVILCGSVISMMYSEVLSYSAPLHGRRTSNIRLQPLKFAHIRDFLPDVSPVEHMSVYGAFGGVPKYLEIYDPAMGFLDNVTRHILDRNSYLYQEIRFLLKEEIGEPTTYFSLLLTMARGERKIGNIAKRLQVSPGYLGRYMQKLMDLDLIVREVPVTEKNPAKSRLGRYRIKDQFVAFWFSYVFKNSSLLEMGQVEPVVREIEATYPERILGHVFEDYALEMILDHPLEILGFLPEKVGRWWNNREKIDLVAMGKEEVTLIECKWRNQPVGYRVYQDLIRKGGLLDTDLPIRYVIFSKSGFEPGLEGLEGLVCMTYPLETPVAGHG
ncbi:ATP-binding protein [Desulfoplanes sp.]